MRAKGGLGAVGVVVGLLSASQVRADPIPPSAEHVPTPGRSVASDDTADAVVLNPANLAFLPAPELRWTYVYCPSDAVTTGCGHAWEAATPLPFGLATALRLDLVQPPSGVGFPYGSADYVWVTWGLATKLGRSAAIGMSLEHSYSQNGF